MFGLLIALSMVVGAALIGNVYTIGNCVVSLAFSQRRHLQRAVAKLDVVKSEGYLQVGLDSGNAMLTFENFKAAVSRFKPYVRLAWETRVVINCGE